MLAAVRTFYYLGLVTQLGLAIVISILAGLFLGIFLDGKLQTKPWLTVIFLTFGVIGGFMAAYRLIMDRDKDNEGNSRS